MHQKLFLLRSYLTYPDRVAESPINLYKKIEKKNPVTNIGHTVFPLSKDLMLRLRLYSSTKKVVLWCQKNYRETDGKNRLELIYHTGFWN